MSTKSKKQLQYEYQRGPCLAQLSREEQLLLWLKKRDEGLDKFTINELRKDPLTKIEATT